MTEKKHNPADNLVSFTELTQEEQREIARKGGKASVQARREKKLLSQIYAEMLAKEHNINIDGVMQKVSGQKLAEMVALQIVMQKNNASVSMLKEMREATEGSKAKLDLEMPEINIKVIKPDGH